MHPAVGHFLNRVRTRAAGSRDLSRASKWIEEHTQHPKHVEMPWTFLMHEMQKAIVNDSRPHVVVRKCSQVGLSEVLVRLVLAMMNIFPQSHIIYTLQTATFARTFTKTRFDPVIKASKSLCDQVDKDTDSTSLKQIGASFLYIQGASGQGQAISVPADSVVNDEEDFSDPVTLSTYASRLGHNQGSGDGGFRRRFSTPTMDGYGVSAGMETSSMAHYTCRCYHCRHVNALNFFKDVVIPGFDAELITIEKEDLADPRYQFDKACYICQHCGKELTVRNLADPEMREWVEQFPDREIGGYQVGPHDVPTINTAPVTVKAIGEYKRKADWVNFKTGETFQDSASAIMLDVVRNNATIPHLKPREGAAMGTVAGLDLGKTSWILNGKRIGNEVHVFHGERIRVTSATAVEDRAQVLAKMFGVGKMVVDTMPNYTTALAMRERLRVGCSYGCEYARSAPNAFSHFKLDEEEQIVKAHRTGIIDYVVKEVNEGRVKFARHPEFDTMLAHFDAIKRITRENERGEKISSWVNTSDDHFLHALVYLMLSLEIWDYLGSHSPIIVPLGIHTARLKVPETQSVLVQKQ